MDTRVVRMGVLWLGLLGLAGCGGRGGSDEPVHLTLLSINDFHGAMLDRPVTSADETPRKGGAAMLSAYVDAIRDENPGGVVLVDAGDMLQGPLMCNRFEGAPVADLYRQLGVAAAALGNHDFDYGPVGERSASEEWDERRGALGAFAERGGFPILSANVALLEGGQPLPEGIRASTLVEAHGVKVGLIGVSTEGTGSLTVQQNVSDLRFDPPGPAVKREVGLLREQGAEVIVVIGHLDGTCGGKAWPPPEVCEPTDELAQVLQSGEGEVDAVFVGHHHVWFANTVDGVAVAESGSRGRSISRVDLIVDPQTRRVDRTQTRVSQPLALCEAVPATGTSCLDPKAKGPWTPATYNGKALFPDPEVESMVASYTEQIASLCQETLATAAKDIWRTRKKESAVGNLVTDAMLAHFDGVDVALCNSGSMRANLPAGPITYCELYAMFPFDNRAVEVRLTGEQLTELMRIGTSGAHSVLQMSGLKLAVDKGDGELADRNGDGQEEDWERDRLLSITTADGKPIRPTHVYRVVVPDYVYNRPDDMQHLFGTLPPEQVVVHDGLIREMIVEFLRADTRVLGEDGGWPYPQKSDPRIRFESP